MKRGIGSATMIGLAAVFGAFASCNSQPSVNNSVLPSEQATVTPKPLPVQLSLSPSIAEIGQELSIRIDTVSLPVADIAQLSLGNGTRISSVQLISPSSLEARLTISPDAAPGYRSLTIVSNEGTYTQDEALLLQAGSLSIQPTSANRGQTIDVQVLVSDVVMVEGYTWIDFGDGITTTSFDIIDENHAQARLTVDSDASSGPRDVALQNGPSRVMLPGGFEVDRGLIAITFSPPEVFQDQIVEFTISGYGTHFAQGRTALEAGLGILVDSLDPESFIVESPTRITGIMEVCQSAVTGAHYPKVTTDMIDGPPEIVQALNYLNVIEVPVTVERATGSFYLGLSRLMRDGVLLESVYASATFTAHVSACGSSNGTSCAVSTLPFDQVSFYPPPGCTPTSNTNLFPPAPTLDAGAHVYFEVPDGPSIQLNKQQDADGYTYYASTLDIPIEDFLFDASYDIRVDGAEGPETVPEFTAKKVLATPPSDFRLVEPDLRFAPTLDRYDSLTVRWTDTFGEPGANTFPVAGIYCRLRTEDATGAASEIRVIPADDGEYIFPAEYISQLYPGAGRFLFQVSRLGSPFALPGSAYQSSAVSAVSYDGYFELRD